VQRRRARHAVLLPPLQTPTPTLPSRLLPLRRRRQSGSAAARRLPRPPLSLLWLHPRSHGRRRRRPREVRGCRRPAAAHRSVAEEEAAVPSVVSPPRVVVSVVSGVTFLERDSNGKVRVVGADGPLILPRRYFIFYLYIWIKYILYGGNKNKKMVSFMNNCGVNKIEQYMRGIESSAHLACFSVPLQHTAYVCFE
jgi:hypothetical protein